MPLLLIRTKQVFCFYHLYLVKLIFMCIMCAAVWANVTWILCVCICIVLMCLANIYMGIHSAHSDVQIKEIKGWDILQHFIGRFEELYVNFIKYHLKPQLHFDENKSTAVVSTVSADGRAPSADREGIILCIRPAQPMARRIHKMIPARASVANWFVSHSYVWDQEMMDLRNQHTKSIFVSKPCIIISQGSEWLVPCLAPSLYLNH